MKNYIIFSAILMMAVISFGCSPSTVTPDEPTDLELQLVALMNNNSEWGLTNGTVMKDGFDVTSQFNGFALSVGEFIYTTQNALQTSWPTSGNWEFSNNDPNKVLRSDGVLMDVILSNNQLIISFAVTNLGGKSAGINGNYEFTLSSN